MQLPGIGTERSSSPRQILATLAGAVLLPKGGIIEGAKSRDPENTGDTDVLRAGVPLALVSGKYRPAIVGVLQSAYTSGGTEITVTAAQAAEIVRRIGSSGNLTVVGPPSAGGVVAEITKAYSAVNTSTGVITIADLGANMVQYSLVLEPVSGTPTYPVTLLAEQYGIKVTDEDKNNIDVQMPSVLAGGVIKTANILPEYANLDASLKAWLKAKLRANAIGFAFDDDYE